MNVTKALTTRLALLLVLTVPTASASAQEENGKSHDHLGGDSSLGGRQSLKSVISEGDGSVRPVPDPTVLTTQQLIREIAMSRDVIETRLAGMDKAIELLQQTTDKLPANIKDEVEQLQELHAERFSSFETQLKLVLEGIKTQFLERDERTKQLALLSETAIAAALQAQKEAATAQNVSNTTASDKMELNFAKLIEQTQTLLQSQKTASDDKISDIKDRGNILESRLTLIEGQKSGGGDAWGYMFGLAGLSLALLMLITNVVTSMRRAVA